MTSLSACRKVASNRGELCRVSLGSELCAGLQRRLTEEYERCQNYLDVSTRKPLISVVEEQLLSKHMAAMLEKGFDSMMADMRVPDLARLYNLCGRIHALEPLRAAFRAYIKKAGLALIMDEEKVGHLEYLCCI